ncbi:AraC family transcriptional regulator [Gluconacetobacter sacchari]|uniref:helix-turn-helix transcriptional regulator n=1 Tax=Gluconacetobacter sacchari TaxID=92759 RepID=UPI0039B6434A
MRADIRSYGGQGALCRHLHAQIVLPLEGALELEIAGKGGRLSQGLAGFVGVEVAHAEYARRRNRFLVVDIDAGLLDEPQHEQMARRSFLPLPPAARHLVGFMLDALGDGSLTPARIARWAPLFCDTVLQHAPRPGDGRLRALKRAMEAEPGGLWTIDAMARLAGISPSRLHALFRAETGLPPRAWLNAHRVARIQSWLRDGSEPLAALALRAGFCDQSAMTRAFVRETGMTPGRFRRMASPADGS